MNDLIRVVVGEAVVVEAVADLAVVAALSSAFSAKKLLRESCTDYRHRDRAGCFTEHRQRHDRPVFHRPRGLHDAGRLHVGDNYILRFHVALGQLCKTWRIPRER